ncbi:MAG: dihydrolipoyl dehydrogenase [Desulfobacteraceae bacterium]|nr:dihydrolipoyl dehydrogenase [Desulfobacteraceae bacterium]
MPTKIVVIGGGPGGYVAAIRAAVLGADVTLIEKENLGGTCLNRGCIPSKIMKNSADLFLKFKKAGQFGIQVQGDVTADLTALMGKKNKIIQTQRNGIAALMQNNNISVEKGRAKIKSHGIIDLISDDENSKELAYDKLIIATGTKPLSVTDFPFDHSYILSSNDLLEIQEIPKFIVIVGGGVIGCEFAFIFAALGSQVTIVEAMSRLLPLPSVDEECSKVLLREMKKKKIKVYCDTIVKSSKINDGRLSINLELSPFTDNPKPKKLKTKRIVSEIMAVCIGRSALSKNLGLENIGLQTMPQGWIDVNEKLETSKKDVYAIGDILGPDKVMLAHVASHEGIIAAQNAMGKKSVMDYNVIPSAIFTMPEIGTVGLSESEARKKGYDVEAYSLNFRVLGKAQAIDELAGMAKMIVEKPTNKVIGVHLIGAHATDLIAEATLAIQNGLTASQIAHTIHAHPTLAEIISEVSLKASGMGIHG